MAKSMSSLLMRLVAISYAGEPSFVTVLCRDCRALEFSLATVDFPRAREFLEKSDRMTVTVCFRV